MADGTATCSLPIRGGRTWGTIRKFSRLADRLMEDLHAGSDAEYVSKEEVLAGIDRGMKEMIARRRSGRKAKTLEELIGEL